MFLREILSSQIEVTSIDQKGVIIRAGTRPETGDINSGIDMSLYYELANVMKPYLHIPQIVYTNDDKEEMIHWHNRFFNNPGKVILNTLKDESDMTYGYDPNDLPF